MWYVLKVNPGSAEEEAATGLYGRALQIGNLAVVQGEGSLSRKNPVSKVRKGLCVVLWRQDAG